MSNHDDFDSFHTNKSSDFGLDGNSYNRVVVFHSFFVWNGNDHHLYDENWFSSCQLNFHSYLYESDSSTFVIHIHLKIHSVHSWSLTYYHHLHTFSNSFHAFLEPAAQLHCSTGSACKIFRISAQFWLQRAESGRRVHHSLLDIENGKHFGMLAFYWLCFGDCLIFLHGKKWCLKHWVWHPFLYNYVIYSSVFKGLLYEFYETNGLG